MAYNYYQAYGNAYKKGERINTVTKKYAYTKARYSAISEKQMNLYSSLFCFLLKKGLICKGGVFDKPKNVNDCRSKINAMFTILNKNGLRDEFFEKVDETNEN